jgi:hypothetical protein
VLAATVGGAVGLVLLLLAVWIEPRSELDAPAAKPRIAEARELAAPGPLQPGEGVGGGLALESRGVALQQGAWVQVADETGRLAQQYSASRIDPERDRWMRMVEPRAMMFPRGGRVITMRSERGRLRVPDRAIESGRLEGAVVIRMYRPEGDRRVDTDRDAPAVVVEADEALFDSRLGEIRCDRTVRVVTDQLRFSGEGLTMLLTPDGRNIERLTVERPLSPIEIVRRVAAGPSAPGSETGTVQKGPGPPAAPATPASDEPRFYRLTLDRDVRVRREGSGERTRIEGDRLQAVFSLEGNAIGENLARGGGERGAPASLALAMLSGAMAAVDAAVERTEIRYAGRLTMELLESGGDRPPSRNDVLVDITGAPTRLDDERSGARIDCGRLRYVTGDEAVLIESQAGRRFVLASPRLDLEATSFSMNRRTGRGRIDGEGRMRLGGADGAAVQVMASMPAEAARGAGAREAVPAPASARTVRMEWSGGVGLAFEPGSQAARLRQADFRGAVRARADEVRLDAERIVVDAVSAGTRDAVTRLLAEGAAKAVRQPEGGSLAAERIDLKLEPLADGGSRPRSLLAEGRVEAADGVQRLWTDAMTCTFRPMEGDDGSPERVDVAQMTSTGSVQALVSGDARIWAGTLEAEPSAKRVTLTGPDLLLARGATAADGMSRIELDDLAGVGFAPGPGRCRAFDSIVADASAEPRPRPTLPERASMEATWTEGLRYHRIDPSTSEVQLTGSVKAVASRTATERDDLESAEATLVLADAGSAGPATLARDAGSVRRVRARGGVRLESRAWGRADRGDEPRLFRLVAEEVSHDVATGETEVPTPGTLLVFDRDDEGARAKPPSLFDGRGTTRFKWGKRLDMRLLDATGRYRIDLDDAVEMLHAGVREQDTMTLTCDRLQATVERAAGGSAGAEPVATPAGTPADLGAPVQLQRIEALGRVFVRTPEVDVECDAFDHDIATGIAQVSARPGRMITVLQRGVRAQPTPVQAESAVWDMQNGRIRLVGLSGSGIR